MPRPLAVDLSAHYTERARLRELERIEGTYKPDDASSSTLINLDIANPSPAVFPFETLSAQILRPDAYPVDPCARPSSGFTSWITNLFTTPRPTTVVPSPKAEFDDVRVRRFTDRPEEEFEISTALTYAPSKGLIPLAKFVRDFTERIHQPPYEDWGTLVNLGAAEALTKTLDCIAERGDAVLIDEWAYNHSLEQIRTLGIQTISVPGDTGGMDPCCLEDILANWDEKARGCARPKVLLIVPVGQNPTGITFTAARKLAIYELCVKWDLIMIEDDTHYFLQLGPYTPPDARLKAYAAEVSDEDWLKTLVPSFLHFDYQGRVIRLDSFSKVIGPGTRLGSFTASKQMINHLTNAQKDLSTSPSGLSQVMVGVTLLKWGQKGFVRWLRGVRGICRMRRDWTLDLIHEYFDVQVEMVDGHPVCVAYSLKAKSTMGTEMREKDRLELDEKSSQRTRSVMRFVPPTGGMVCWFEIDLASHPTFLALCETTSPSNARASLAHKLLTDLIANDVLLRPGPLFQSCTEEERDERSHSFIYMRASYGTAEYPELKRAIEAYARVLDAFFGI